MEIRKEQHKERTLVEICLSNNICFSRDFYGKHYCGLGLSHKDIKCFYFGKRDHNEINRCKYSDMVEQEIN